MKYRENCAWSLGRIIGTNSTGNTRPLCAYPEVALPDSTQLMNRCPDAVLKGGGLIGVELAQAACDALSGFA